MSVYVDKALIPYRRMKMSHMIADDLDELHAMAESVGLKRSWFQDKELAPHYDLCQSKREEAIKLGAKPLTRDRFAYRLQKIRTAKLESQRAAELADLEALAEQFRSFHMPRPDPKNTHQKGRAEESHRCAERLQAIIDKRKGNDNA